MVGKQPYIAHKGELWLCKHGDKGTGYKVTERAMRKPPICPICGKYMSKISRAKPSRSK